MGEGELAVNQENQGRLHGWYEAWAGLCKIGKDFAKLALQNW